MSGKAFLPPLDTGQLIIDSNPGKTKTITYLFFSFVFKFRQAVKTLYVPGVNNQKYCQQAESSQGPEKVSFVVKYWSLSNP